MYEGISSLCFCCRRLGHKLENCSYHIQPMAKAGEVESPSQVDGSHKEQPNDTNYEEWMLVTKKKRSVQVG